jgi:NAD(P)-dependent dehydrogenase (short-subunit alcohol dehydrogenase family)
MARVTWTPEQMPSQAGKTILITGANSGLGLESARLLAGHGAELIMACRNPEKGQQAVESMRADYPEAKLDLMQLDLSDLQSVRDFADQVHERYDKLDVLLNNAGIMAPPFQRTRDGFEMQMGTNHLGHFALTGRLLDLLENAEAPRVVTVSSLAQYMGRINLDNLNAEKGYHRWLFYGHSKLANLMFARELDRRLRESGSRVQSLAAHPGYSSTNLQNDTVFAHINQFLAQPQHMGAYPSVYAATSEEVERGGFYGPNGLFGAGGYPAPAHARRVTDDRQVADRLWKKSEELTGVAYLNAA